MDILGMAIASGVDEEDVRALAKIICEECAKVAEKNFSRCGIRQGELAAEEIRRLA